MPWISFKENISPQSHSIYHIIRIFKQKINSCIVYAENKKLVKTHNIQTKHIGMFIYGKGVFYSQQIAKSYQLREQKSGREREREGGR